MWNLMGQFQKIMQNPSSLMKMMEKTEKGKRVMAIANGLNTIHEVRTEQEGEQRVNTFLRALKPNIKLPSGYILNVTPDMEPRLNVPDCMKNRITFTNKRQGLQILAPMYGARSVPHIVDTIIPPWG